MSRSPAKWVPPQRVAVLCEDPASGEPPVLHGDGVTDDTNAVQWYLDRDIPFPPLMNGQAGYLVRWSALRYPSGRTLGYFFGA